MAGSSEALARQVLQACKDAGLMVATAESCTGGMVAAALTDVPGSSVYFQGGVVSYSNDAKASMLGVPMAIFRTKFINNGPAQPRCGASISPK